MFRRALAGPLRAVIVNTKSGQIIRGALVDERRGGLILRAAAIANVEQQGTTWEPLDGEVVIPAENIDFWQDALPASTLELA